MAAAALCFYLVWRIVFTLPTDPLDEVAAWSMVVFESLPLPGMILNTVTWWNIDASAPPPSGKGGGRTVALLIPTYNEPAEVLAPTVAAACELEPAHETWVLDDGDRSWVSDLCRAYGARYVRRDVHDHAKAGNINHALGLMEREAAAGAVAVDIIAVLDCDHVPLPTFLSSTLGWFGDPDIALVQGPQSFYNSGAFDDDGVTGEQGLFFNVQMRARNAAGAGSFWCGSTSLLRVEALREVGGVATETITEDMHTTLKLIRRGWRTVYHHQTLALGLAPATPEQYLLQRRRWGMGAMQILTHEKLWAAKRWMSWRNFHEYLNGTLWWLEGIGTLFAFLIPALALVSGAQTSTADPLTFSAVFAVTFAARLWGAKRLMRHQIHWPTAFALRIFRIPIGIACVWWLATRRHLRFEVTPKGAADSRARGALPPILMVLALGIASLVLYCGLGLAGVIAWRATLSSTVAAGAWLLLSAAVIALGVARIRSEKFATSRRNAHRVAVSAAVTVNGVDGQLIDISVGGVKVHLPVAVLPPEGQAKLTLPEAPAVELETVKVSADGDGGQTASLRVRPGDWNAHKVLSLWLFHTPPGAVPGLGHGIPAIASVARAPGPASR
ncbi:glycosyltransferase family 2 protein [Sinomonas susongensis]|uniref:glycosyltransferase family 2 protein n=1 Tax=Sinomonas susongensis TaxID=1324851 RepID=UPI00148716E7|nr:glycosyltransferase [Sinomonas susongensis]